jgi:hypothetical protein
LVLCNRSPIFLDDICRPFCDSCYSYKFFHKTNSGKSCLSNSSFFLHLQ